MILGKREFETIGRHTKSLRRACQWIRNRDTGEIKILSSKSISDAVDFYTQLSCLNKPLAIFKNYPTLNDDLNAGVYTKNDRILFIFPHPRFGGPFEKYQIIYFILERDLLDSLRNTESDYLIVSLKEAVLKLYLDNAVWSQSVFINDEVSIYKINTNEINSASDFNFVTSNLFADRLKQFQEAYPEKFEQVEEVMAFFNLSPNDLTESSYENMSRQWVRNNIPTGARIAYSSDTGECKIASGDHYLLSKAGNGIKTENLASSYDYLFINYDRAKRNATLPPLDLTSSSETIKVFPRFYYMGDGWVIYDLNKDD